MKMLRLAEHVRRTTGGPGDDFRRTCRSCRKALKLSDEIGAAVVELQAAVPLSGRLAARRRPSASGVANVEVVVKFGANAGLSGGPAPQLAELPPRVDRLRDILQVSQGLGILSFGQ